MQVRIEIDNNVLLVLQVPRPETYLTLLDHGMKKFSVIKEIRCFTGWDLKTSKDASEQTPKRFTQQDVFDLKGFARALEAVGAKIEIVEGAVASAYPFEIQLLDRIVAAIYAPQSAESQERALSTRA